MLFLWQYSASILFLGVGLVLAQPPTDLPRQYRLQRNVARIWNDGSFSIADLLEKEVYYKIKPPFYLSQRKEVFRYPENKKKRSAQDHIWPTCPLSRRILYSERDNQQMGPW